MLTPDQYVSLALLHADQAESSSNPIGDFQAAVAALEQVIRRPSLRQPNLELGLAAGVLRNMADHWLARMALRTQSVPLRWAHDFVRLVLRGDWDRAHAGWFGVNELINMEVAATNGGVAGLASSACIADALGAAPGVWKIIHDSAGVSTRQGAKMLLPNVVEVVRPALMLAGFGGVAAQSIEAIREAHADLDPRKPDTTTNSGPLEPEADMTLVEAVDRVLLELTTSSESFTALDVSERVKQDHLPAARHREVAKHVREAFGPDGLQGNKAHADGYAVSTIVVSGDREALLYHPRGVPTSDYTSRSQRATPPAPTRGFLTQSPSE